MQNARFSRKGSTWSGPQIAAAFAVTAPGKVKGRSQVGRLADLVALVRFALEQQPAHEPFAESANARFENWIEQNKPEALELSPFTQRGGSGKTHQLFAEQLPRLLDEPNQVLAA